MLMRSQLLSGASSVAHLVGLGRFTAAGKPATPAPTVAMVTDAAEAETQAEAGSEAVAADPPAAIAGAPSAAAAPAAEIEEGEEGEDDDVEKDDDEEEMAGKGKKAAARRRERARCRAVLTSPHAAKNPGVAMYLALQTAMPRQQVLAMLEAMPKGAGGLDARMAGVPQPPVGAGAAPQPGQGAVAIASAWDAAFAKIGMRGSRSAANDSRSTWDRVMSRRQ
ncbi:MAG: hypothetical protein WDN25_24870 [Acetobacteraceae bacterium]